MDYEKGKYWIWYSRIEGLTCLQKGKLLEIFRSPERIWNLDAKQLRNVGCLNEKDINEILNKSYRGGLNRYYEYMNKNKIRMITIYDKEYPDKLKEIYDRPVSLFAKGNTNLFERKSVAIVGCRECSEYGKRVSKKLAYDLANQEVCIVSGLARGIDKFSHIGALDAKGSTIAVIGNGLDDIYPYENKNLSERILENDGLIVTEYIIGTKPSRLNFPARNRIISGLSEAVVVVEAKEKSGALITADFGLEQGKEVCAVPNNIYNKNSKGTNELIKQGASLITGYRDVLELIE